MACAVSEACRVAVVSPAAYGEDMSPALSPSRAADFKQCPLLYRFRVVDRLPSVPSPAAARGTLVHAVLEAVFDLPSHERTPAASVALLPQAWAALVEEEPELAALVGADSGVDLSSWLASAEPLVQRWFTLEDPDPARAGRA